MEINFNDYRKQINEWCVECVFDTTQRGEELFEQSKLDKLSTIEEISFLVGDLSWCGENFWNGLLDCLVEKFDLESVKNNVKIIKPDAQTTYDYIFNRYFELYESRKLAEKESIKE